MNMKQRRFALTSVCLALSWLCLFGAAGLPYAGAQDPPPYSYDVLSGIQPAEDGTAATYDAGDVLLTQGWHYWRENAVDIDSSLAGTRVYAAIRAIEPNSQITAEIDQDTSENGCEYVLVRFVRTIVTSRDDLGEVRDLRKEDLGEVRYLHTRASWGQQDEPTIMLPTTAGAVTVTQIGTLLDTAWIRVRTDDLGLAIQAEIAARVADGTGSFVADGVDRVGNIQEVVVDGTPFRVRQIFGEDRLDGWYEQSWRAELGEAKPASTDGADCASTGPHLHQAAPFFDASGLWRNIDRDDPDDDGFGFPVGQIDSLPHRVLQFCSDTWVFRLQSSQTAPQASPVQPCGAPDAAPANLTASAGDRRIALHWTDPNDATITGYDLRVRLSSASSTTTSPWGDWEPISGSGAGTTSHTVTRLTEENNEQLNNETAYTLQIRAVNANGYGPAATASATPTVETPTGVADTALKTLALSGASLTFDSTTTSYAVTVDDDLSRTTVTAEPNNSNASLEITPSDANPSTDAHEVDLAVGVTTITVKVDHGGESRTYTVTVTRPDPLVAPVVGSFSASGTTLTGGFTWSGSSPRFLRWRLYRATSEHGTYSAIGGAVDDSVTPVTFSGQARGYWYQLRGQACEHRADVGARGADAAGRQSQQLVTVCGSWSAYSDAIQIANLPSPPPPVTLPLTLDASVEPESCYPDEEVTVSWTSSGGEGGHTYEVDDNRATSPTKVTCDDDAKDEAGKQKIEVSVTDSAGNTATDDLSVTVMDLKAPVTCLSDDGEHQWVTYGGRGCGSVQAEPLLTALRDANPEVCGIGRWQGDDWVRHYIVRSGLVIPGSVNFTIDAGHMLWLLACDPVSSSGGAGGASSGEPPNCPDALQPETGPATVSLDSASCAIVRSGGSAQVSRGDYTLNLTLPSERDWFVAAPTNYNENTGGAFLFFDLTTGGWIALNPADGAELARHAPADADGLPALLDAIAASASAPAAAE